MNKNFFSGGQLSYVVLLGSALALMSCSSGGAGSRSVDAGTPWQVAETTQLAELTIAAGAQVTAAKDHSLTMTVDGVETPIAPGSYKGNIVLTPTKDIDVLFEGMGPTKTYKYRVGIYVDNGAHVLDKSVASAVVGGSVSDTAADNVKITSVGERFNGIVVTGDSTYAITRSTIQLTGNGKNDFNGVGAAIKAGGASKVTVDGANIKNQGAVRPAIWVGDNSVTTINNAEIDISDGVLPADYGWSWVKGGPGDSDDVMMQVPWMLGLKGNARATLVVGSGTAIYNNSHIKVQHWGAMSTDAVREVKLDVNKSHIETGESGYGAFADGNSLVTSSGSTWDVDDYGFIMSRGSVVITDGSKVKSGRFGVMSYSNSSGNLTIDKSSVVTAEKAVIQLKSASPTILVDNAQLVSKRGLILQIMAVDDPNNMPGGVMAGGMGAAPSAGAPPGDGGMGGGGMSGAFGAPADGGKYSAKDGNNDVDATFRNVTLTGDFLNSLADAIGMNLKFENANITGAISTATAVHDVGPNGEKLVLQEAPDLYRLIGEQTETLAATSGTNGANVALDAQSKWTVSKTSYLTNLSIAPGAQLSAMQGNKLRMTVNGVSKPIAAGSYQGKIVLEVSKGS